MFTKSFVILCDPINYMGFAFGHGLDGFIIGERKSSDGRDSEDDRVTEGKVGTSCENLSNDNACSPDDFVYHFIHSVAQSLM